LKFSLPTGKVVNFPSSFFFEMPDDQFAEEIENLIAMDMGYFDNEAFSDSVLMDGEQKKATRIDPIALDDVIDNDFLDIVSFFEED